MTGSGSQDVKNKCFIYFSYKLPKFYPKISSVPRRNALCYFKIVFIHSVFGCNNGVSITV